MEQKHICYVVFKMLHSAIPFSGYQVAWFGFPMFLSLPQPQAPGRGMILAKLKQIRPYVIVGAFIVAAVVTPPDVMSQLMLAVPLVLLYEVGLLVAPIFERATRSPDAEPGSSVPTE